MKSLIAGLAIASASALGFAPAADAHPVHSSHSHHHGGRGGVGIGIGFGGTYASGGYYRTEYQWVQQTILVGYDRFGHPVYGTTWVQQPISVWVPAPAYVQPTVNVGFGWRW